MIYLAVEHLQSGAKSLLEKFTQEGGNDYIDEAIAKHLCLTSLLQHLAKMILSMMRRLR